MKTNENKCFRERVCVESRIAQQFDERWGWLVEEYAKGRSELKQAYDFEKDVNPQPKTELKPFPATSSRMVGWLSVRPECQLEVFGPDLPKARRLPVIYTVTKLTDPVSDGL